MESETKESKVSLTQMLKALDKDVASGLERRLKKLSKKKAITKPLDKNKADLIERKAAYSKVSKELKKWDPIVEKHKAAKQISFPLDQQADVLPATSKALSDLKPSNELEKEILQVIQESDTALHDGQELSKAEEKYLKAISLEEAKERHLELQRMRVLLSSYAAKMRRQKAIKSKSYRRLLKQERLRKHIKKVESDKDLLMDEIERLQRLRAKERASLKHKNTGKWAKHAKFRAKYDDEARKAMLEQIGIANKLLEKPLEEDTDDTEDSDDDDVSVTSEEDEELASAQIEQKDKTESTSNETGEFNNDRLIVSSELINERLGRKGEARKRSGSADEIDDSDSDMAQDDSDEEDEQRKLMSEAFANDDVVAEFKKAKSKITDEEQPKNIDLYLPGWNEWTGPGTKVNRKKRAKYRIKAKKLPRKDSKLGNVIISELADDKIKQLQVKKVPRGLNDEDQLAKRLCKPTAATFVRQTVHRNKVKPKISTRLGARIEPMSEKLLAGGNKAKWFERV